MAADGNTMISPVFPSRRGRRVVATALVSAASVAIASPSAAAAVQHRFKPVADAYVTAAKPRQNFGQASRLRADAKPFTRSYVRFSVSGVDGRIVRAVVRLYAPTVGSSRGYRVRKVANNTWRERRITFASAPRVGSIVGSSTRFARRTWTTVDVTRAVRANGRVTFAVGTGSENAVALASRESSFAPRLVVETRDEPVVMVGGDIACDPASGSFNGGLGTSTACRQMHTSNLLHGADAVLTVGDNQYEDGALAKFNVSYDPSWGRFKSITYPSPGNHEYVTSGAAGYFDYFGARAGERGKGWYAFDLGAWRLYALNSNCGHVGGCGATSPQAQWLRADLAAHPRSCVLAYMHHPRFSSGDHGDTTAVEPLWRELYDAGADLVLAGHDHNYERLAPMTPTGVADATRGIRSFVVGESGKNHRSIDAVRPNSEARDDDAFGVLELTLRANGYEWDFVDDGTIEYSDSGSALCH